MCNRGVCDDHLAPRVDATVCAECAARQDEQNATEPPVPTTDLRDPKRSTKARYRQRQHFYDEGYSPFFWGTSYYSGYYDDYDMQHFGDDDTYEGGFGDS
jgi:hypothetical protein